MARTTIRWRLTLLFGITIVLVVALVGFFVSRQMQGQMIAQARKTAAALAGSIAAASSNDFLNYNYVALEQKAEEASRDPEVAYVILYDKEGEVAAYSEQGRLDLDAGVPGLESGVLEVDRVIVREGLANGHEGRGLDTLAPVIVSGSDQHWGVVRLGLRLESIYMQIRRTRYVIFLLGLAGTVLGWVLAALFTRRITVPLKHLVSATVDVSKGQYDVNLEVSTGDEIQDLTENFQWMAGELKDQRQALEQNLREIKELKHFSDLVLLSMTNGLMTLDERGVVVTFNRMAEKILAIPAEDVLGRTPGEIWGEDCAFARLDEEVLSGEETVSVREVRFSVSEEELILEVSMARIIEADNSVRGHLVLIEDFTEKRILEDRLRRADRLAAMGTLAAGLAHEIKNPLTAVRAFVQMFPEKYEKDDFREKFNRIVPTELDRVNELLENLLNLVRKPKLKICPLKVHEIVDQLLETLEPETVKRNVAVEFPKREVEWKVLADESYLVRALHNLVLNAIQAMPGGGRLSIEIGPASLPGRPHAVSVSITDTGPGIPSDQVDDIFNPFFTSKEKGTGLGLAVSNKIVEDHEGSLTVKSERFVGTTMTITLPSEKPERPV
jgi:two-component system sensor histidine kinase AtoS